MHFFRAYGLSIQSYLALAEQPLARKPTVDVTVRLGKAIAHSAARGPARCEYATPDEVRLVWDGVGASTIKGGREIIVDPCDDCRDERLLSLFISGPVIGVLLHQLGRLPLHASVVAMKNRAVAFLAAKGQGKSTMAAALEMLGHEIVADDTLAVSVNEGTFVALYGFPLLKIWPDVVSALGEDASGLARVHPELEKRARPVARGSLKAALPLAGIYVLDEAPTLGIGSIGPSEAFFNLVRHSYALRFLGNAGVTPEHFLQCARLANSVPTYCLRRPACLRALPSVAHFVEDHVFGKTAHCAIPEVAMGQADSFTRLPNLKNPVCAGSLQ